jgi:DNA-binding transcriptional LysR family regulator
MLITKRIDGDGMAADDLQERLPRHLKLRELRVLLAVAEQGSFRKAARLLHLTQPAITAAIAELEAMLGVALFDRTARGVTPTAHGESFIRRASAIFGELRLAAADIQVISGGARGTLRVGTGGGGWGMGILPTALTRLLDPQLEASVMIREADEDVLVEQLKARELDMFFSRLTPLPDDSELAYRPLYDDSICVFARRTHPLAARKRMTWDDLAGERWVVPPAGSLSYHHIQRTLHKGGLAMPRHVVQATSAPVAFGMVLHGNFLCFGTHLYYEFSVLKPLLSVLAVHLPQVMNAFGVVTLKDRQVSPLGERLIGHMTDLVEEARRRLAGGADQTALDSRRAARARQTLQVATPSASGAASGRSKEQPSGTPPAPARPRRAQG